MSGNGKGAPLHVPAGGVPIIGTPVSVQSVYVPLVMALTCNCSPAAERAPLAIHPLAGLVQLLVVKGILTEAEVMQAFNPTATCSVCHKTYNAFQPASNVQIPVGLPAAEQVPA